MLDELAHRGPALQSDGAPNGLVGWNETTGQGAIEAVFVALLDDPIPPPECRLDARIRDGPALLAAARSKRHLGQRGEARRIDVARAQEPGHHRTKAGPAVGKHKGIQDGIRLGARPLRTSARSEQTIECPPVLRHGRVIQRRVPIVVSAIHRHAARQGRLDRDGPSNLQRFFRLGFSENHLHLQRQCVAVQRTVQPRRAPAIRAPSG